jgi:hypothetical protein
MQIFARALHPTLNLREPRVQALEFLLIELAFQPIPLAV